jgi:hypothetical protein
MTVRVDTSVVNALADAFAAFFDSGVLEVRDGAQPADADTAASGSLLASITLPATAFGAAAAGAVAKNGTWQDASANASGTTTWFRLRDAGDTYRLDGSCGQGSGDLSFDDSSIVAGGVVTVTAFTVTMPES